MRFFEFSNLIKPQKPLTPAQARIKALKDQVKRSKQALKAEKARQKIRAGQQQLSKASTSFTK